MYCFTRPWDSNTLPKALDCLALQAFITVHTRPEQISSQEQQSELPVKSQQSWNTKSGTYHQLLVFLLEGGERIIELAIVVKHRSNVFNSTHCNHWKRKQSKHSWYYYTKRSHTFEAHLPILKQSLWRSKGRKTSLNIISTFCERSNKNRMGLHQTSYETPGVSKQKNLSDLLWETAHLCRANTYHLCPRRVPWTKTKRKGVKSGCSGALRPGKFGLSWRSQWIHGLREWGHRRANYPIDAAFKLGRHEWFALRCISTNPRNSAFNGGS